MDIQDKETATPDRPVILCVANSYTRKFFMDPAFERLPLGIREDLKLICVEYVEEVGGILTLSFAEDGEVLMNSVPDDADYLYDEVSAGLLIGRLRSDKAELWEALSMYYRVAYLGGELE